jgi:hypothetical protein
VLLLGILASPALLVLELLDLLGELRFLFPQLPRLRF